MFIYDKFCHVASNERWQKQGALFVYETIDALSQITTAGYFNRAKLDLNLGDLIFATIITEQEATTYETYVLRVIGLDDNVVVEQVEFGTNAPSGLASVSVDSTLKGNGTPESPIGLSQQTLESLETVENDISELGEQLNSLDGEAIKGTMTPTGTCVLTSSSTTTLPFMTDGVIEKERLAAVVPAETGTFVLKCIEGTLTWVAETGA